MRVTVVALVRGRPFRSHIVGPVLAYLEKRGVDVRAFLRARSLPLESATLPYVDWPLVELRAFLDAAAERADEPLLGVHVGRALSRSTWDLLQLNCLSAATLGDALENIPRYIALFNADVEIVLGRDEDATSVSHVIAGHAEGLSRHGNELWLAALLDRARSATGVELNPLECWFGHAEPTNSSALAEAFGCAKLRFSAGSTGLRVSSRDLALPLRSADPVLLAVLERLTEPTRAALSERKGVSARALWAIEEEPSLGEASIRSVARRLAVSTRSLQRSLADERTSFRTLVEQVRRERARALCSAGCSPDEIAARLGYSERSAFVRAFGRWSRGEHER